MPADDFDSSAEGTEVPISDELVNILHRTGRPPQSFTAELHRWVDGQAGFDGVQTFRSADEPLGGLLGPDALWQALGERDFGSTHWIARLRLADAGTVPARLSDRQLQAIPRDCLRWNAEHHRLQRQSGDRPGHAARAGHQSYRRSGVAAG